MSRLSQPASTALLSLLVWLMPLTIFAADKPLVGLRMELMSIRNRSSGPLPVRIRLEYNQPQMLEGDLQLSIFDGQDFYTAEDLIAKLRFDDIVLVGQDYQFNAVLPPLQTSTVRNWSIEAVFITESGQIPLSSIVDKQNPPEAFDLITSNPAERSVLLCSCSADPAANRASQNRLFLEKGLSLENYNPLNQTADEVSQTAPQETVDTLGSNMTGRSVIHFAGQWAARDLPLDPLSYCAFDVVLLSDGALARLNQDQMDGLSKWVRAGGSVCILPDAPMKPMHLELLRTLLGKQQSDAADLALDAEGRLILADALTRASELKPELLIDFATLTGAARVALGPDLAPLYTDDDQLAGDILAAAKVVGDPVWRMPLWAGYEAGLKSPIADMKNLGDGPMGGSITAALFLKAFVDAPVWAHFDIWAWRPARYGRPAAAAACGLRAVWEMLKKRYV